MALIVPGALVAEARGAVGGVVFARNRAGLYARSKGIPVQPNSPRQVSVRLVMAQASALWSSTLSASQRDGWNTYAANTVRTSAVGNPFLWSGQQSFVAQAAMRLGAGLSALLAPPNVNGVGPGLIFTASILAGGLSLDISAITNPVGLATPSVVTFLLSRRQNAGISFFRGPFTLGASLPRTTGTMFPISIPLGEAVLAPSKLFVSAKAVDVIGRVGGASIRVFPGPLL